MLMNLTYLGMRNRQGKKLTLSSTIEQEKECGEGFVDETSSAWSRIVQKLVGMLYCIPEQHIL